MQRDTRNYLTCGTVIFWLFVALAVYAIMRAAGIELGDVFRLFEDGSFRIGPWSGCLPLAICNL